MNLKENIILFGAGGCTGEVLNKFPNLKVNYIVDNDSTKWGTTHCGFKVKAPTDLFLEDLENTSVILCTRSFYFEIYNQLIEMGIKQSNIINGYWLNEQAEVLRKRFKQKFKGDRVFLIGNGPSLTIQDLELLKNEITFATNKIYLAYPETEWRPSYYFVEDYLVAKNFSKEISELNVEKFMVWEIKKYFDEKNIVLPNAYWINYFSIENPQKEHLFSENIEEYFYGGYTVMYFMLQVAYYMGFKEIYLLGVDFSFSIPKEASEHSEIVNTDEINHFHPQYRLSGEKWTYPNLKEQYAAFKNALDFATAKNIKIVNCSRKTKLDVFPIKSLEMVLLGE